MIPVRIKRSEAVSALNREVAKAESFSRAGYRFGFDPDTGDKAVLIPVSYCDRTDTTEYEVVRDVELARLLRGFTGKKHVITD